MAAALSRCINVERKAIFLVNNDYRPDVYAAGTSTIGRRFDCLLFIGH